MTDTVLVVEDNRMLNRIYEVIFQAFECRVVFTGTIARALRALETDTPTLIIMDQYLADGSGSDAIAAIRAQPHLAETPILAVTSAARAKGDALRAAGATEVIPKPFEIDAFNAVVRSYLTPRSQGADLLPTAAAQGANQPYL